MNSSVMADVDLTVPERTALWVLMHFVEEVPNSRIAEEFGFTIDGKARDRLVELGYVTCRRAAGPGRPFLHELTEAGWQRCGAELSARAPKGADKAYRLVHPVLNDIARFLAHHGFQIADVYASEVTRPAEPEPATADDRIRAAYLDLAAEPEALVNLDRVRTALADLSREEVDEALLRLDLLPGVYLVPEDDQRSLSAQERAAAIRIGDEDKHRLSITSSAAAPPVP